jgi:hypothetical protein
MRYYETHYAINNGGLNYLAALHGSDKGSVPSEQKPYAWAPHTYADYYEHMFRLARSNIQNVFECGIGTNNPTLPSSMGRNGKPGASLRMWRDYFPKAAVVGADIDADILFQEDRITTYQCDQTAAESLRTMWELLGDVEFDIFIDDGLHTAHAARTLFDNSYHKVKSGGVYIIEDLHAPDINKLATYFLENKLWFSVTYLHRTPVKQSGNSLITIFKE